MKQEIEFASHPGNLLLMRNFVRQFLAGAGFSTAETDLMVLGLDEACTNIIRHAYKLEQTHPITLCCEKTQEEIRFRLRDLGEQGDPNCLKGRPLDMIVPGGLGVHLIRKAFDQVDYNLKQKGTELVLTRKLQPQPPADTSSPVSSPDGNSDHKS